MLLHLNFVYLTLNLIYSNLHIIIVGKLQCYQDCSLKNCKATWIICDFSYRYEIFHFFNIFQDNKKMYRKFLLLEKIRKNQINFCFLNFNLEKIQ